MLWMHYDPKSQLSFEEVHPMSKQDALYAIVRRNTRSSLKSKRQEVEKNNLLKSPDLEADKSDIYTTSNFCCNNRTLNFECVMIRGDKKIGVRQSKCWSI